jgi:hypothetical protein
MAAMLVKRFVTFMHHLASLSIGDSFAVPISEAYTLHKPVDDCKPPRSPALRLGANFETVKPPFLATHTSTPRFTLGQDGLLLGRVETYGMMFRFTH